MKHYLLLKDIYGTISGRIFNEEGRYLWREGARRDDWWINELIRLILKMEDDIDEKFFQLLEEVRDIPKFKIWDYVVYEDDLDIFDKISAYNKNDDTYCIWDDRISRQFLRKPTKEELLLYFR